MRIVKEIHHGTNGDFTCRYFFLFPALNNLDSHWIMNKREWESVDEAVRSLTVTLRMLRPVDSEI